MWHCDTMMPFRASCTALHNHEMHRI
jgi:hypothetical protein